MELVTAQTFKHELEELVQYWFAAQIVVPHWHKIVLIAPPSIIGQALRIEHELVALLHSRYDKQIDVPQRHIFVLTTLPLVLEQAFG